MPGPEPIRTIDQGSLVVPRPIAWVSTISSEGQVGLEQPHAPGGGIRAGAPQFRGLHDKTR